MLEALQRILSDRSGSELARDALDVFVVAFLVYRVLLMVRGTRAMQVGIGLGIVFLVYVAAKSLELVTLESLLQYVISSLILIVVVVFQNDIRRALMRVGGRAWFTTRRKQEQTRVVDEVVAAVTELARHRIGAIIAFERGASIDDFAQREGVVINAAVTRELLVAIFYPEGVNKLHDGAVVIRDLKIARAGVFFPMVEAKGDAKNIDRTLGTRHQAAVGVTEESDAVVVVVSEERGVISFCFNGNIVPNIDATVLRQSLETLLERGSLGGPSEEHPPSSARASIPPPRATLIPGAGSVHTPIPRARTEAPRPKTETVRVEEPLPNAKSVGTPMRKAVKSALPRTPSPALAEGDADRPSFSATTTPTPDDGPQSESRPKEP